MKLKFSRLAIAAVGALCAAASVSVVAQTWSVPTPQQRCPSKWGANDERGSANHQNARAVMRAKELIRTGEVMEIAHPLDSKMAFFGTRRFDVHTKR